MWGRGRFLSEDECCCHYTNTDVLYNRIITHIYRCVVRHHTYTSASAPLEWTEFRIQQWPGFESPILWLITQNSTHRATGCTNVVHRLVYIHPGFSWCIFIICPFSGVTRGHWASFLTFLFPLINSGRTNKTSLNKNVQSALERKNVL